MGVDITEFRVYFANFTILSLKKQGITETIQ